MRSFIICVLYQLFIRAIKPRKMRWTKQVSRIKRIRILAGKLGGKRTLARPRHRCVDNIKMDKNKLCACGLDSTRPVHGQAVGSCGNGNEPSGSIKSGEFLDQLIDYQIFKKAPVT
jgi:hypothetical protein